jgi:serine protease Do
MLVSPDGTILTAMSTVLDTDEIDCVLDDGSRHRATLKGVDPRRELALLTIDAVDLPAFTLEPADPVAVGTRVIALSNLFGVAVGDERVSAQRGVVSALVPLEARRGAAEAPFTGDVYVLDCTTNNPGAPGGAVVDSQGRLIGMLGKELRATATGIWLNYALPAAELDRHLAELAIPALRAKPLEVALAQLNREVPAAVAAAVAAVALLAERQDGQRDGTRSGHAVTTRSACAGSGRRGAAPPCRGG